MLDNMIMQDEVKLAKALIASWLGKINKLYISQMIIALYVEISGNVAISLAS